MKYVIIGTAGHVDHGKTALIKALTGTDTDRLKEEKARGISIDLGFASLALGDGITAGIVDVPGHERFLKNMLAGTGGIDLAMLVIAADEGVMPQTREHLAMLELFGVKQGIVVLSKIDKVDEDWLELVVEEVTELLAETLFAGAPVCRVSAVTGAGLGDLRGQLLAVAAILPARDSQAPFRLWIDRTFAVKGHGAVVTGTALSGSVKAGDSLCLQPAGVMLRVRGVEWHGQKVDQISAGQRAALNLGGADAAELERGMMVTAPVRGVVSREWDVLIDWLQEAASATRIRLHLGTGEFLGRVYRFKGQPATYGRLILEAPLPGGLGDRAIIRRYSPQHLLGGATLIAPSRPSRKLSESRRLLADAVASRQADRIIFRMIADQDQPAGLAEIKRQVGYLSEEIIETTLADLLTAKEIILIGNFYLTIGQLAALSGRVAGIVGDYHRANPDRAGLSKEILRQQLHLKERVFEELAQHWQTQGLIVVVGGDAALRDFAARHGDWRRDLLAQAEAALEDVGLTTIDSELLAEKLQLPRDKARTALEILQQAGLVLKVGEMHVYSKTIQNIAQVIQTHFQTSPLLTVGQLRDLLGTSRKVALPLLEYYDLHKYTVRDGDNRRPGPKCRPLSE